MLVTDRGFKILCHLPPSTIMSNPEWVRAAVEQYFNEAPIVEYIASIQEMEFDACTTKKTKAVLDSLRSLKMPTPEEYARSIGFSNFASLRKAIENTSYPEPSRHYLLVGCSVIADLLTRAGLTDRLNSKFVQFIMSAYLGINEKTEIFKEENKKVTIEWGSTTTASYLMPPAKPLPAPADILMMPELPPNIDEMSLELDRLEKAMPEEMKLPVYKMAQLREEAD